MNNRPKTGKPPPAKRQASKQPAIQPASHNLGMPPQQVGMSPAPTNAPVPPRQPGMPPGNPHPQPGMPPGNPHPQPGRPQQGPFSQDFCNKINGLVISIRASLKIYPPYLIKAEIIPLPVSILFRYPIDITVNQVADIFSYGLNTRPDYPLQNQPVVSVLKIRPSITPSTHPRQIQYNLVNSSVPATVPFLYFSSLIASNLQPKPLSPVMRSMYQPIVETGKLSIQGNRAIIKPSNGPEISRDLLPRSAFYNPPSPGQEVIVYISSTSPYISPVPSYTSMIQKAQSLVYEFPASWRPQAHFTLTHEQLEMHRFKCKNGEFPLTTNLVPHPKLFTRMSLKETNLRNSLPPGTLNIGEIDLKGFLPTEDGTYEQKLAKQRQEEEAKKDM